MVITANDSEKLTRESRLWPPVFEGEGAISLEQPRSTEAIPKAMLKESAPLIAGRDQARPARSTTHWKVGPEIMLSRSLNLNVMSRCK